MSKSSRDVKQKKRSSTVVGFVDEEDGSLSGLVTPPISLNDLFLRFRFT